MLPDQALELVALERGLLSTEELLRLRGAREEASRRGAPIAFGTQLIELGRVSGPDVSALLAEAQARARDCPHCRRTVLIPAGPPWPCPACRMPLVAQPPGVVPSSAGSSARIPNAAALLASRAGPRQVPPGGSSRFPAVGPVPPPGSSSRHPAVGAATGRYPGGSSRFVRPAAQSIPSTAPGEPGGPEEGASWSEGRRIGRYELLEELGRGAMGVVYRVQAADQPESDLALKLLLGGDMASPSRRKRFEDEVRVMMRLDHPNLVKVRDWGLADGLHPFYVMDYVPGRDLRQVLKEGSIEVRDAVRVVMHLARALDHVHAQGVLHRDLKPDNVRVQDLDLSPTLFDFGLAKDLEQEGGLTRSGVALGTPHYMAPEQAEGRTRDVGPRTDVWSLGVILYELIAGQVPFTGKSMDELVRKIARDEPAPLRKLRPGTPRAVEEVVRRALRKSIDERFPSAGALAEALEDALAGRGQGAALHGTVVAAVGIILLGGLAALLVTSGIVGREPAEAPTTATKGEEAAPPSPLDGPEVAARIAEARAAIDRARASDKLGEHRGALEEAERLLSTLLERGEQAEARWLRGLVRRDLDRWDDARADLVAAAGAPRFAARAQLARGLIDLRWSGRRSDAEQAWGQALPAADANAAERAAGAIAQALKTGLSGDLGAARRGVEAALSERPEPEVATEALCGLAWTLTGQVQRGGEAGAALSTLLASERLFRAPRFRYDYALDRALLLALAGRVEDAIRAREDLLRLTRDGLGPDLVQAHILRRQGKAAEALRLLREIASQAAPAGVDRAEVQALLLALEGEAQAPPVSPPTPAPKPAPKPAPTSQLPQPVTIVPPQSSVALEVGIPRDLHGVWIAVRGPEGADIDLHAAEVKFDDPARSRHRCDRWSPDEDLVLVRGDPARPLEGEKLHLLVHRSSPSSETVPVSVVIRPFAAGKGPHLWADGDVFPQIHDAALAARLRRAQETWVAGEVDAALLGLGELVQELPGLALLRCAWLGQLGRWEEAEAALEPLLKQEPDEPRLITWRARCWRERGQHERGVAPLQALVAARPALLRPRLELAECLLASQRVDEALAVADAVLALDPYETRAMALQAIARARRGDATAPDRLSTIAAANDVSPTAAARALEEIIARGDPARMNGAALGLGAVWRNLSAELGLLLAEAFVLGANKTEGERLIAQLEKAPLLPPSRLRLQRLFERLGRDTPEGR